MAYIPDSDINEAMVLFRSILPRTWRNLYEGCVHEGFDTHQAFLLLQTYILAQNPNGSCPPGGNGPDVDKPE